MRAFSLVRRSRRLVSGNRLLRAYFLCAWAIKARAHFLDVGHFVRRDCVHIVAYQFSQRSRT